MIKYINRANIYIYIYILSRKVYNNIMNSIKAWYKMDSMFINSENSNTSGPHRFWK